MHEKIKKQIEILEKAQEHARTTGQDTVVLETAKTIIAIAEKYGV